MPVCKAEAHRALELLEDYYSRLDERDDRELKAAIERVIKIFKSRLFQALLDIQEFYELTLMDDGKTPALKTQEAIDMASRWEAANRPFAKVADQPMGANANASAAGMAGANNISSAAAAIQMMPMMPNKVKDELMDKLGHNVQDLSLKQPSRQPDSKKTSREIPIPIQIVNAPYKQQQDHSRPSSATQSMKQLDPVVRPPSTQVSSVGSSKASSVRTASNLNLFEYDEIILERGDYGLGFSIAGGVDNPHVSNDSSIYITKLIPGGAAAMDKRLRVNDIILKVNDVGVVNVPHSVAVDALKKAGNRVILSIKRKLSNLKDNEELLEVELSKGNKGLGITIAGGIGNQHIPGDNGIYVTKIMDGGAAAVDGRIEVGDRLVSVKNHPTGDFLLDNCTHEESVNALKKCKDKVVLLVSKGDTTYPSSPTMGQMHQMGLGYSMGSGLTRRSISDEELRVARDVVLHKSAAGLGFNIVGGEDGEGIFISFILAGGPADVSGQVKRGDKILSVNGVDLSTATHEEAAIALKNAGNAISLRLLYSPDDYEKFEAKIHSIKSQVMSGSMLKMSEKKSLYVRALFDYDPGRDDDIPSRGLTFSFGDVIHVINASDDDWWQARKIDQAGNELNTGLIPSRNRWERKMKSRDRNVRWGSESRSSSGNRKSKKDLLDDSNETKESADPILSYELVQQVEIDYTRPVIVLGPLKDRINDELISEFPDRFGSCVPHTTRPKRQFEVDGRDYHFVKSREIMEADIQNHKFIEAGQYNDNLYGTSIASVKEVAERGKHCILDVSGNAIKRLQAARLFPVALFVRPQGVEFIKRINADEKLSDDQVDRLYSRAMRLEADFIQYFSAIVPAGDNFEDVYSKIKSLIRVHSCSKIWVPANEMF